LQLLNVQVSSDSDVMMVSKQQQQQKRRAVFGDITNVSVIFIFVFPTFTYFQILFDGSSFA